MRDFVRKRWAYRFLVPAILLLSLFAAFFVEGLIKTHAQNADNTVNAAFNQAAQETGVPIELLKALCYMEGRLSNHGGQPSIDHGYGCMHLLQNKRANTLDQAAKDLNVSIEQLKSDIATNIRGGAAVLRDNALQLSSSKTLPSSLADWYAALANYSNASTQQIATMYADSVYAILKSGFSATTDSGETVTLAATTVTPNTATAHGMKANVKTLPKGCVNDGQTDYPGAIDCIVDPTTFDCNIVPGTGACTYFGANRPTDYPINFAVIHDVEGSAQDALSTFQDVNSLVSAHYIVDTDGTIYQVIHEHDIAFHAGNLWYNQRSVGIEHAGFDATGFQWYNATQYLASAKLTAYLLKKYTIPLDRSHVLGHGNIPSPNLANEPNHVDPGPYWLWDYYFKLIDDQGLESPAQDHLRHIITLRPRTDLHPYGKNGTETPANFNFFYLYQSASTKSPLLPADSADVTDERNNVEPGISYYYTTKVKDEAGTGDTMYQIWYGVEDPTDTTDPAHFKHAQPAWLAVPPGYATEGDGALVTLNLSGTTAAKVYGKPATNDDYVIGDAPNNAIFVSGLTVTEAGTTNLWYEINYNHRQAWVPATEVSQIKTPGA